MQLKKELAALRDENCRLQDAIKRQAGNVARVENKLANIESLLLDPDCSHNLVTFYQLRAVGNRCHERLRRHADKLLRQREEAVQSTMLAAWRRRREDKAFTIKRKVSDCRTSVQDLEVRLSTCRTEFDNMGILQRLFRRRSVETELESLLTSIEAKRTQETALLEELQRIESNSPPGNEGLDVRSKRMVNFQILAFAQQLYLQYDERGLAQMVRDARELQAGAIRYGDKQTCDAILTQIRDCDRRDVTVADNEPAFAKRARLIADSAEFRREEDVVPTPASVATVYAFDEDGSLLTQEVALLSENYFGIGRVLIR